MLAKLLACQLLKLLKANLHTMLPLKGEKMVQKLNATALSTPNICQHALATAQDLACLSSYLQWVRRTKKSSNLSQLIADSVPKSGGQKSTQRRKGAPKNKRRSADSFPMDTSFPSSSTSFQSSFSASSPQPFLPPSTIDSTFSTPTAYMSPSGSGHTHDSTFSSSSSTGSTSYMSPPSSGHTWCSTFSPVLQINSPCMLNQLTCILSITLHLPAILVTRTVDFSKIISLFNG